MIDDICDHNTLERDMIRYIYTIVFDFICLGYESGSCGFIWCIYYYYRLDLLAIEWLSTNGINPQHVDEICRYLIDLICKSQNAPVPYPKMLH